jgi:EAL domain-containing protein (putative c-di-GMP-specific phosphodiesterase class I)
MVIAGSVGLSAYPDDADDARDLLQLADIALYQAKRHARGDVCRYTPALGEAAQEELAIELELRAAMADGRIAVALQPRRRLADGISHAAEALVRLRREDGTLLLPTTFLPVAERCGLLPQLGGMILAEAMAALATLRRQPALADFRLSVNLSPVELQAETLVPRVAALLEAHALPPAALEIELTETALIDDPRLAAQRLAELKALGVAIALDDFGAGYSGLSHLLRFPISVLKIDRSFIEGLRKDRTADALVESLIALAKRLGLHVVAEGIEAVALLDELHALGCDEAQGYAVAEPMPLPALQRWLLAEASSAPAIGAADAHVDMRHALLATAPAPAT